jgi:hypothetical protein
LVVQDTDESSQPRSAQGPGNTGPGRHACKQSRSNMHTPQLIIYNASKRAGAEKPAKKAPRASAHTAQLADQSCSQSHRPPCRDQRTTPHSQHISSTQLSF